jgi:hypothetical protein
MKPHKHAELMTLWADGAEIEVKETDGIWRDADPLWCDYKEYRIKTKEPVVRWLWACRDSYWNWEICKRYMTEKEAQRNFVEFDCARKLDWSRQEFDE